MEEKEITFESFGLHENVLEALGWMGFKTATPIQIEAIPTVIAGDDVIACAQTGTGKTAAFLLPVMHKICSEKTETLNTIILSPTRELAVQIDKQAEGIGYSCGISTIAIYGGGGGQDFDLERKALTGGCNIIVATPGRLLSHLNLGYAKLDDIKHFILDEADRMLDMGFYDDIVRIAKHLPAERQTLLFSATMPPKIRQLALKILKKPKEISISISKTAEGVVQESYSVYDRQKIEVVKHIVADESLKCIVIFCSTKHETKKVSAELQKQKYNAKSFHSDLDQQERDARMLAFKNKSIRIFIATDIIARGIDVEDIDLVINFSVPNDAEDYVHRVGRTARAKAKGRAITLINEQDQRKFQKIESLIQLEIPKLSPPESLGAGPVYDPSVFRQAPKKNFKKKKPFKKRPKA